MFTLRAYLLTPSTPVTADTSGKRRTYSMRLHLVYTLAPYTLTPYTPVPADPSENAECNIGMCRILCVACQKD